MGHLTDKEIIRMLRTGENVERELGKRAGVEACENGMADRMLANRGLVDLFGQDWMDGFNEAVRAWEILHP